MDSLKSYHDVQGETLTVWFDDPAKECVAEETGEEVVRIKDETGRVVGFERFKCVFEGVDRPRLEMHTV